MQYPEPIARLIDSYMKLPGIGQKTATRLAFYTIDMKDEVVNEFAKSLLSVKRDLHFCSICGNITEGDPCEICSDPSRDKGTILVVEEPKDVMALEKVPWALSCFAWCSVSNGRYWTRRYQYCSFDSASA